MNKRTALWSAANEKKRDLLVFWLLAAAVCVMRLWHISELHAPFLYNDEIGYWSHAANLAGLSWTKTESAWYSYGYSLLLVPLFWISHNMEILYRLAIIENALLGVAGFWAGFRIILELDEGFNKAAAMFISFVAASYSAYIFQSNIAWSETFVYAWFLVTALLAVRFCKRPTYRNTVLVTAAAAFLYVIHNRTLAIWVALLMTFAYMLIRRRISWKHLLLAVGILAAVYLLNGEVKDYLNALMWGTQTEFKGNNVSAQSAKLKLFTSVSGIKRMLKSLAGKIWYLFSSTFLMGYLGLVYLFAGFFAHAGGKRQAADDGCPAAEPRCEADGCLAAESFHAADGGCSADGSSAPKDSAFLFLGLSALGTLALAVIVAVPKNVSAGGTYDRLDTLFYGRYTDMIAGLLIMLGLAGLYKGFCSCRSFWKIAVEALSGLCIYGVCFIVVQIYFSGISEYGINIACVPGVFFRSVYTAHAISFKQITAIAAFVFVMIVLGFGLFRLRFRKVGAGIRCLVIGLAMVCVFWKTMNNGYDQYIGSVQSGNYNNYSEVTEVLNANTQYTVFCKGLRINHMNLRQYIRATVVEGNVVYSTPDEENYFLFADSENLEDVDFTAKHYYYIKSYWGVHFLVVGDEIAEDLESQGYECTAVTSLEDIETLADGGTLTDEEAEPDGGTLTDEETETDAN